VSQIQHLTNHNPSETSSLLPFVQVNNLCMRFVKSRGFIRRKTQVVQAVDNISFEISESEIMSVVGESGSGKTTIARCIMALTIPTSGTIKYKGIDVARLRGKALLDYRREVQVIYQDPFESLIPNRDVFTTLSIPIKRLLKETDRLKIHERITALLQEVGLDPLDVIYKFPHQLSGGERQRINIARALAPNPKLLIADEPITMLDASQRLNILSLLMELKVKRNLTILLITHDLASAKLMSDRIVVMYSGKLMEIGPTNAILSTPHHPYTELVLSATPRLRNESQIIEDYSSGIEESENVELGCIFRPRCKFATQICKEVEPPLLEKSKSHLAACHNALNL